MQLETLLCCLQCQQRPKHKVEQQDFESHSWSNSSSADLPFSLQVSDSLWHICKTVKAAYSELKTNYFVSPEENPLRMKIRVLNFNLLSAWLHSSQAVLYQVLPVSQMLCARLCNPPSSFRMMKTVCR